MEWGLERVTLLWNARNCASQLKDVLISRICIMVYVGCNRSMHERDLDQDLSLEENIAMNQVCNYTYIIYEYPEESLLDNH